VYQTNTTTANPSTEKPEKVISTVVEPYTGLTTDFHALLIDNLAHAASVKNLNANSVLLWYLARMLDKQGSGWADIDITKAIATLGVGKASLRRYAVHGQKLGLFRHYKRKGGIIRVYYTSLSKVCLIAKLPNWGGTVEINESDLLRLKSIAAEVTAKVLQTSSRFLAKRDRKRGVPSVKQLLNSSLCSRGVTGKKLQVGKRFISVSEDMPTFGATQAKMADLTGRSTRTINKRLSNSDRAKYDLPPIFRRQILKQTGYAIRMSKMGISRIGKVKFFRTRDRAFESRPNVYSFDHSEQELTLTRNQRRELRRSSQIVCSDQIPDRHLKSKKMSRYIHRRQFNLVGGPTAEP
jgi:hypothetical protein